MYDLHVGNSWKLHDTGHRGSGDPEGYPDTDFVHQVGVPLELRHRWLWVCVCRIWGKTGITDPNYYINGRVEMWRGQTVEAEFDLAVGNFEVTASPLADIPAILVGHTSSDSHAQQPSLTVRANLRNVFNGAAETDNTNRYYVVPPLYAHVACDRVTLRLRDLVRGSNASYWTDLVTGLRVLSQGP